MEPVTTSMLPQAKKRKTCLLFMSVDIWLFLFITNLSCFNIPYNRLNCFFIQILGDDYSKLVFLCADRSVNLHAKYGSHYSLRIPRLVPPSNIIFAIRLVALPISCLVPHFMQ
jgi:hypothetical protein